MSQDKPNTAVVCDGEVDTDDEEPPTPRVPDSQAGPVGGSNVFFLKEDNDHELTRNDPLCDDKTPTTEQYHILPDDNNRNPQQMTQNFENACKTSDLVPNMKSMTESSDIEVIEEKDSSDSIEVLGKNSPDTQHIAHSSQTVTGCDLQQSLNKLQVTDSSEIFVQNVKSSSNPVAQSTTSVEPSVKTDIDTPDTNKCQADSEAIPAEQFKNDNSQPMANGSATRPNDLSLPRPLKMENVKSTHRTDSDEVFDEDPAMDFRDTDRLIQAIASTPLQNQGTVIEDGEMVSFVAEDLQEKIISSPASRTDSYVSSRYGSRTPSSQSSLSSSSASGWSGISTSGMSRSPSVITQSPEDMPPIDPRAVFELDIHARKVAESLAVMMKNIKVNLHKLSSYTTASLAAYQEGVDHTCDSVDATIKSMYALMAKCEELSKTMLPVYELGEQIKEIKRLVELFENQLVKED